MTIVLYQYLPLTQCIIVVLKIYIFFIVDGTYISGVINNYAHLGRQITQILNQRNLELHEIIKQREKFQQQITFPTF
jgi:hypothetical protein